MDSIQKLMLFIKNLVNSTTFKVDGSFKLDSPIVNIPDNIKLNGIETITLQGAKGDKGDKGDKGEKGDNGKDGKNGLNGKNGKDGKKGDKGIDGKDGRDGINGKDGKDGVDGKDGSPDDPITIKEKLETLKDDDRLSIEAIKNLSESLAKRTGGGRGFTIPNMSGYTNALLTNNGSNLQWVTIEDVLSSENHWDRNATSGYLFPHTLTDNVGIGTSTPAYKLDVAGGGRFTDSLFVTSGGASITRGSSASALTVTQSSTGNILDLVDGSTTVFTVLDGGNVGIGTTTPATKLQVHGTEGAETTAGILRVSTNAHDQVLDMGVQVGYYGWIQARHKNLTTPYSLALNPLGGNVGIGTTSPSYKLHIASSNETHTAQMTDDTVSGSLLISGAGTGWTHSRLVLQSSSLARGSGIYTFNSEDQETWFFGNKYGDWNNSFVINRQTATASFSASAAQVDATNVTNLFAVNNAGRLYNRVNAVGANEAWYTALGRANTNGDSAVWTFYTNTDVSADFFGKMGFKFEGGTSDTYKQFQVHIANATTPKLVISGGGNVGIGTTTPGSLLHVSGASASVVEMRVYNTNTVGYSRIDVGNGQLVSFGSTYTTAGGYKQNGALIYGGGAGGLQLISNSSTINFYTGGTADANERMIITSAGFVGIGTTGPTAKLHVVDTGTATVLNFFSRTSSSAGSAASIAGRFIQGYGGGATGDALQISSRTTNTNHFLINAQYSDVSADMTGTTAFIVRADGNVGIGTTAPTQKLAVYGSTATLMRLANTTSAVLDTKVNYQYALGASDTSVYTGGVMGIGAEGTWSGTSGTRDSYMYFAPVLDGNEVERVRITSGGNVGIGTTSPEAKLTVAGNLATTMQSTTLAAAATAIAVTSNVVKVTGDAGANTIATITGGINGQTLVLIFVDALVTITDTNAATANTVNLSAAFTSAANTTLTLVYDGNKWFETARSVNG